MGRGSKMPIDPLGFDMNGCMGAPTVTSIWGLFENRSGKVAAFFLSAAAEREKPG